MLDSLVTPHTVIDAGHYGIIDGPSTLQTALFAKGVALYSKYIKRYPQLGLFLLLDDVWKVNSNEMRDNLALYQLPSEYLQILSESKLTPKNLHIYSQSKLRDKGRKLLEPIKAHISPCELVVAMAIRKKEMLGYKHSLGLYDTDKTDGGINLPAGSRKAEEILGAKMDWDYMVFSSIDKCVVLARD